MYCVVFVFVFVQFQSIVSHESHCTSCALKIMWCAAKFLQLMQDMILLLCKSGNLLLSGTIHVP